MRSFIGASSGAKVSDVRNNNRPESGRAAQIRDHSPIPVHVAGAAVSPEPAHVAGLAGAEPASRCRRCHRQCPVPVPLAAAVAADRRPMPAPPPPMPPPVALDLAAEGAADELGRRCPAPAASWTNTS